jgi:methionyl-tRNA synthetase
MDRLAIDQGSQLVFRLADATNEYIAASEPWALAKQGRQAELDTVLWTAAESLRIATVLLAPVMPASCERILERLGAPHTRTAELRLSADAVVQSSGSRQVAKGDVLWPRLESASAPAPLTKETSVSELPKDVPGAPTPASAGSPPASPAAPATPVGDTGAVDTRLSIDDFMKIDLRVARILAAERVPKSSKLMKLSIDLGTEQRQIVAGIAEAYEADALVGRTVAIVANLKPAKLMGVESNGMILAASPEGGKPILLAFDQTPPPGTRIR